MLNCRDPLLKHLYFKQISKMVTPVASRFSLLSLDDDGDTGKKVTKHLIKKKADSSQMNNNNSKPDHKKKKKKPDGSCQASQNQNQNDNKIKNKNGKGAEKKKKHTEKQWEQWKEKDAQLVDGTYEDELQEAILLSQLDYEENKEYYDQRKKQQEEEKKNINKKVKKSTRSQPMSLGQFNSLTDAQIELGDVGGGDSSQLQPMNGKVDADPEFFERVKSDAKKAFKTEEAEAKRKAREPLIDEVITLAQYKDRLERSDQVKASLTEEVQQLKEELQKIKSRNQKLCELLFKGEMQDMAKLLVSMDKLQKVKDELLIEVSSLHVQLEQERSKVRALTGDNKHTNKKKGVKFDASCETSTNKDKEKR